MQIGKGKQGIKIGEYGDTEVTNGVIGYVQPACDKPQWIIWFTENGEALIYTEREPNGAVVGKPIRLKAKRPKA